LSCYRSLVWRLVIVYEFQEKEAVSKINIHAVLNLLPVYFSGKFSELPSVVG